MGLSLYTVGYSNNILRNEYSVQTKSKEGLLTLAHIFPQQQSSNNVLNFVNSFNSVCGTEAGIQINIALGWIQRSKEISTACGVLCTSSCWQPS
mmetsp:Transcript_8295/g.15303  ORF Transcript_8295/g.15303 Transcript_8295/m.15303 type:complete len:94 (-) Transcript_8295:156-437(-)